MNESGRSVGRRRAYFKVAPEAVLVIHDESDLELGACSSASAAASPVTTA